MVTGHLDLIGQVNQVASGVDCRAMPSFTPRG